MRRSVISMAKPFVAKHGVSITAARGSGASLRRSMRSRKIRRIVIALSAVAVTLVLLLAGLLATLPSVGDAEHRVQQRLMAHASRDSHQTVPVRIAEAIIAVEDASFRANSGVDVRGIGRGVRGVISGGADRGGSTITQQLAKALYVGENGGVSGKVRAIALAMKMAKRYRKVEILEMYAAVEYFGHGAYGMEQASQLFFHRSAAELDWAEASMLAGLLQAPSRLDPVSHFDRARARQRHVLDRLVATHTLTIEQASIAYSELSSLDR